MTGTQLKKVVISLFLITDFVYSEKSFWRTPVDKGVRSFYVQNNFTNWWSAARYSCNGQGNTLYHASSLNILGEVKLALGTYWVGAVEYSAWNWTEGSGVYAYQGYISPGAGKFSGYVIQENAAIACHRVCSYGQFWFGLQGTKCYCLSPNGMKHFINGSPEDRCPGNYNEWCGNEMGISVYKSDFMKNPPNSYAVCAYVDVGHEVYVKTTRVCSQNKCFVCQNNGRGSSSCHGGICVQKRLRTHAKAKSTCSLAKIDSSNAESLMKLAKEDLTCYGYWVGLEKSTVRKWIDGQDVTSTNVETDGWADGFVKCLALKKDFHGSRLIWTGCEKQHRSLCQAVKSPPSSPQTTMSTMNRSTVKQSTTDQLRSTKDTTSVIKSSSPTDVSTIGTTKGASGEHAHIREEDKGTENKSIDKGAYIGVAFAILSVIAVVAFLAVTFKQRRFCFKDSSASKVAKGDNHLNVMYDVNTYDIVHGNQMAKTLPVAKVKPIYQNTSEEQLYENSMHFSETEDELKPKYDHPIGTNDKEFDSQSHYEVPVPVANNNETAILNAAYSDDEIYDVLGPLDDDVADTDMEYIRSHDAEPDNSDLYELARPTTHLNDVYQLAGAPSINVKDEEVTENPVAPTMEMPNTLKNGSTDGQVACTIDSEVDTQNIQSGTVTPTKETDASYGHRTPGPDENYDTAFHRRKTAIGPQSETYNHTIQTKANEGYDTTRRTDRVVMDFDDYSHAGEFSPFVFDASLDDETYECIDDTHIRVDTDAAEIVSTANSRFSYA